MFPALKRSAILVVTCLYVTGCKAPSTVGEIVFVDRAFWDQSVAGSGKVKFK